MNILSNGAPACCTYRCVHIYESIPVLLMLCDIVAPLAIIILLYRSVYPLFCGRNVDVRACVTFRLVITC